MQFKITLFSSEADAPASSNFFTTSKCPPSVAICKGVESVILLRTDIMAPLSNLINSSMTDTEP